MKKKFNIRTFVICTVIIALIIIAIVSIFKNNTDNGAISYISYSEMKSYFENDKIYGYEADINEYTVVLYASKEAWDAYHGDNQTADLQEQYKSHVLTAQLTSEEYYRFFNPHDAYGTSELASIQELLGGRSQLAEEHFTEIKETPWLRCISSFPIMLKLGGTDEKEI